MIREALVVGINQYFENFGDRKTPAGDADAIAQLLEQYGEFQPITRLPLCKQGGEYVVDSEGEVTTPQLREELERLFKPESDNVPSTALFFFAGHGHRVKKEDGQYEGFLATSESHTNPEKGKLGLSLQWLRKLLQDSPVRELVVFLDSCDSGEFLKNFEDAAFKTHDYCFSVASHEGEKAHQHPDGKHGMFSGALLKGLDPRRMDKGIVNSSDLKSFIDDQKGWPQRPICLVSRRSIELTRLNEFKTGKAEEKGDGAPAVDNAIDNAIDPESKNQPGKKRAVQQKLSESEPDNLTVEPKASHIRFDKKILCEYLISEKEHVKFQYWNKPICKVCLTENGHNDLPKIKVVR